MRKSKIAILVFGTTLAIASLSTVLIASEHNPLYAQLSQIPNIKMPDNSLSFRGIKDY